MASCPHCGASTPTDSRYCPRCGGRLDESETRVQELRPEETGPVPVQVVRAEPRLYGVAPSMLVLALAVLAAVLAVVLLIGGHWPLALILLGFAVLMSLVFAEAERRRPSPVARSTAEALDAFRARAGVAAESLATRGRAARQLLVLRRELARMASLRGQLLFELGDAVYRADERAIETARARVEELDQLVAQSEAEMQAVVDKTHDRIERRRLEVQPTEVAEVPDEPAPGELNPPEPARIPEPYPPPDEGSPPQPAVIPEPGPAVIPEPGPREAEEEAP
jgi:hypothetical protein